MGLSLTIVTISFYMQVDEHEKEKKNVVRKKQLLFQAWEG